MISYSVYLAMIAMYFAVLIISIAIAAAYYIANRKVLDLGSVLVASIACYSATFAILAAILGLTSIELPEHLAIDILITVPLILGIDVPLLVIALRFARSR